MKRKILIWIILLAPLLVLGLFAFSERWFYPQPFPINWTTETFSRLLSDFRTLKAILDSLLLAFIVSLLSLIIGYPAARVIGLQDFPGKRWVWLAIFLPTVIPPLAIGMGLSILALQTGLAGTRFGIVLAHIVPTLPYTVFTLAGVFTRYDENYEYQALALGASPTRIFFTITLRFLAPGLAVAGLFAFLISWSQYLLTILVGGGRVLTLPVLLFSAVSGGNPTTISALSLLFLAPPVLVIAATARFLGENPNEIHERI
ncbi:MAG: ABC transporter permease subunit [Anaerolineae bacterium]|jgi:putative spermidine/putrescine transport system permease protein|nr:ABC transporter permease subunit [Anaerolineae bacterium]